MREVQVIIDGDRVVHDVDDALAELPLGDEHVVPRDADLGEAGVGAGAFEKRLGDRERGIALKMLVELIEGSGGVVGAEADIVAQAPRGDAADAERETVAA